ncbi:CD3337/EF1877 family mobilome membrane protein, partial [Listeria seeligeri]
MKWRKWLFLFLISCLLVMQAPSMIVQADVPIDYDGKTSESEEAEQTQDASKTAEQKKKEQSKKKNVTSAGVPLKIEQWDIGRYDPYVVDANWIEEAVGALSNALFGLNKIIVDTVDAGMDLLFNMNPLEKFADKMETVNKAVFGSLKTTYGKLFLIISLAFIFYQIAINRKSQGGIRSIVGLIGVLVITGLFMANQSFYVKTCNNIANVAQTTLLSACSVIVDLAGSEGEFVDNDKIDPKNVSKGTVAIMRNIYFDLAVEKPYLIMNYGTPDKTVINKKDGLDGLSRTDTLLS